MRISLLNCAGGRPSPKTHAVKIHLSRCNLTRAPEKLGYFWSNRDFGHNTNDVYDSMMLIHDLNIRYWTAIFGFVFLS